MARGQNKRTNPENQSTIPSHTIFYEKKVRFGEEFVRVVTYKGEVAFSVNDFFGEVLRDAARESGLSLQTEILDLNKQYGTLRDVLYRAKQAVMNTQKSRKEGFLWNGEFYAKPALLKQLLQTYLNALKGIGRTGIQTEELFVPVSKVGQRIMFPEPVGPAYRNEVSDQILKTIQHSFESLIASFSDTVREELSESKRLR